VHADGPVGLDGVGVVFDDERAVANAGIALAATLAQRLGIAGSSRSRPPPDRPHAARQTTTRHDHRLDVPATAAQRFTRLGPAPAGGCLRAARRNSQADPRNSAMKNPFTPRSSNTEVTGDSCFPAISAITATNA